MLFLYIQSVDSQHLRMVPAEAHDKDPWVPPGILKRVAVPNPPLLGSLWSTITCQRKTYPRSRRGDEPYPNRTKKLKYIIEKGKRENPKKSCLDCLASPLSGLKECYLQEETCWDNEDWVFSSLNKIRFLFPQKHFCLASEAQKRSVADFPHPFIGSI